MTESNVHDSLETDNLTQNTSSEIETVTGDKAYDNSMPLMQLHGLKPGLALLLVVGLHSQKIIWDRCFVIISETSGTLGENNGKKKLGIMIEV
ncbi:MAG: hypothetical protein AB8C84_12720 [Oligoflexales bacterium]